MSGADRRIRKLERRASEGDPEAATALRREKIRAGVQAPRYWLTVANTNSEGPPHLARFVLRRRANTHGEFVVRSFVSSRFFCDVDGRDRHPRAKLHSVKGGRPGRPNAWGQHYVWQPGLKRSWVDVPNVEVCSGCLVTLDADQNWESSWENQFAAGHVLGTRYPA